MPTDRPPTTASKNFMRVPSGLRNMSGVAAAGAVSRRESHIYVANWFYFSFIIVVAILHLGNNMTIPVSFTGTKSYIVWAGVQDAMTQWWGGTATTRSASS